MSAFNYNELKRHIGHKIACVYYGNRNSPANVAIECEDCEEILLDFDKPEVKKKSRKRGDNK